jgi:hypothetical protein
VVIAVASPMLTFGGVVLTLVLNRRTAREVDTRWQREETMRLLRWAAELTADKDRSRRVGVVTLKALTVSQLLQPPDRALLGPVLREALRRADHELD